MRTWNVRDQTDTTLAKTLARTYKEIETTYKHIRTAATIEDAKFYIDIAFRKKAFANDIEMEQIRRRIDNGEEE
jgi:hypothetical protein